MRIEIWKHQHLRDTLVKNSNIEPPEPYCYRKRQNKTKKQAWNPIRLYFEKKNSVPNPVKTLWYIKCCRFSSLRHVKSPGNSVRSNCEKICIWTRKNLKPCRKSGKTPHFSKWSKSSSFFTVFSKILLTIERRLAGRYFSGVGLSSTFLNTGTTDNTFQKLEKKIPLNTEKISWYLWKLGFTIFQNHHWNKIRARRLWKIEIYLLFYYKQIYQLQELFCNNG